MISELFTVYVNRYKILLLVLRVHVLVCHVCTWGNTQHAKYRYASHFDFVHFTACAHFKLVDLYMYLRAHTYLFLRDTR